MNRRWWAGAGILEGSALAGVPDVLWEQRGVLCGWRSGAWGWKRGK